MAKEIIARQPGSKKITPDQIFLSDELEYLEEENALMGGCPGHEHLEEELQQSNWPPRKESFSKLREFISDFRFRLKFPHAYRAIQTLIDENKNRTD